MSEDPRQVLYSAIREGNLDAIRSLIISTRNFAHFVNDVCASGVLVSAVLTKNIEVVKLLLENGAEVDNEEYSSSALLAAVHIGDEEIVNMLLNRNADLDAKDRYGYSPLHLAAKSGHLRIAEVLLDHGANINALSSWAMCNQYTPLYLTIEKNHVEMFELLLNKGADVNAGGINDAKPVYVATACGREKMVKLLLENGADVNANDKEGTTILNLAVKYNKSEIVAHILRSGPDLDNRSNKRALNIAIVNAKDKKMIEALLQYGFSIDGDDAIDMELLYAAVMNGFSTVVEDLLNCGADVNATHKCIQTTYDKGFTLLHTAARNKQTEVAKLLINNGANINAMDKYNKNPIFYAVESNDANVAKVLLDNGSTVSNSLFNIAVMEGNREIVELLLQKHIDIHVRDDNYRTALHFAAFVGGERWKCDSLNETTKEKYKSDKTEIAKLLLSRGASVNLIDGYGVTAFHASIISDNFKLFKVLLEHNANVNTECRNGLTPLHASISAGNEVIVKTLLNRGADVNAVSREGFTALYIASEKGSEELVEVLLKYGAKFDDTPKRKPEYWISRRMKNPLSIAAEKGHYKIVKLLLNYGLDIDLGNPTALQGASYNGKVDVVRLLMEHGADINANVGWNGPLRAAKSVTQNSEHYDDERRRGCKEIVDFLEERIVKMKAATMHVDKDNLREVDFKDKYNDLENDCKREIEVMKNEKIANTNVSFYDVLVNDIKQVTMYTRNKSIVEVLESKQLEEKCPLYSELVAERFKRGQWRNSLKCLSSKLIITSLGYKLPENITDSVFEYLSNAELILFINACKNRC